MTSLPIKIKPNGPLFIALEDAADLVLTDHTGAVIPLPVGRGVALCRCGHSKRKPFCDASHREAGFDGTLAAPADAAPPASAPSPDAPAVS